MKAILGDAYLPVGEQLTRGAISYACKILKGTVRYDVKFPLLISKSDTTHGRSVGDSMRGIPLD